MLGQQKIDTEEEQHHGHWVIEESQHKDGVDAVRGTAHEEKNEGRYLRGGHNGEQGQFNNPESSPLPSPPRLGTLVLVVWTHLAGLVVNQKDKQQGDQVEHSKDVLGRAYVSTPVSGIV